MKIGKYRFNITCHACPEQYDVFDEQGNYVAYVRLRCNELNVYCPGVDGTLIYGKRIEGLSGCFYSEIDRQHFLKLISEKIEYFYRSYYL